MDEQNRSKSPNLSRRDFNKLAAAIFSGVLVGSSLARAADKGAKSKADPTLLLKDPHVCRGLNTCKTKGKGSNNDCAGMGKCATVEAHSCKGDNACKGQGGCGEHPGQNSCKGQGDCSVPLDDKAWKKARKVYEEQMAKAGKKFGAAPKKA
jgi:hypothetical protein